MAPIALEVRGAAKAQANLARAAADYPGLAERAMGTIGALMYSKIIQRMSAGGGRDSFWGRTSPLGNYLGIRSGLTKDRITPPKMLRIGDRISVIVGSPDKHVAFLEEGGTRTGTSPRGLLRIPTAAAQTLGGSDRYTGTSIKDIPGVFLLRLRTGSLWAVKTMGPRGRVERHARGAVEGPRGGSRLVFLYLLKHFVKQRGRHIFKLTTAEINDEAPRIAQAQVSAFVRQANA